MRGSRERAATVAGWTAVVPGTARLDVARVARTPGRLPAVTLCESYPLDSDLTTTLARLRQGGKLGGACTSLLMPGDYQLLQVEAPSLPATAPAGEMKEAVRWKIKDQVSFPVAAAGIDVLRIAAPPGRPPQLLVAAASHDTLTPLIQAFQSAKVPLQAIDLPELAQRNIAQLFEKPERGLALLVFSDSGGLLTFTCNGELYATRRIDTTATELAAGPGSGVYERVLLDVQRSLDNFERNFSQINLDRLLVLPPANAEGFVQQLKDNLYQPVEPLHISDGLDISAAPNLSNVAALANMLPVLGAALREEAAA